MGKGQSKLGEFIADIKAAEKRNTCKICMLKDIVGEIDEIRIKSHLPGSDPVTYQNLVDGVIKLGYYVSLDQMRRHFLGNHHLGAK